MVCKFTLFIQKNACASLGWSYLNIHREIIIKCMVYIFLPEATSDALIAANNCVYYLHTLLS